VPVLAAVVVAVLLLQWLR